MEMFKRNTYMKYISLPVLIDESNEKRILFL